MKGIITQSLLTQTHVEKEERRKESKQKMKAVGMAVLGEDVFQCKTGRDGMISSGRSSWRKHLHTHVWRIGERCLLPASHPHHPQQEILDPPMVS